MIDQLHPKQQERKDRGKTLGTSPSKYIVVLRFRTVLSRSLDRLRYDTAQHSSTCTPNAQPVVFVCLTNLVTINVVQDLCVNLIQELCEETKCFMCVFNRTCIICAF